MPSLPDIAEKQCKKAFWPNAKCTNSLRPYDPGTKKYRHKASVLVGQKKLVRVRHYDGPNGEKRKTIEIEV